jgi:hypothetical protein
VPTMHQHAEIALRWADTCSAARAALATALDRIISVRSSPSAFLAFLALQVSGLVAGWNGKAVIGQDETHLLRNIVTWDKHSLFVHGERVLFYSGEFHPFRLPVPDLRLDVFQKIKALGYSGSA